MSLRILSFYQNQWFKTNEKINQLKNYLNNHVIPPNLNGRQQQIIFNQFHNNNYIIENNHTFYRISERINLRIVEPNENKGLLLNNI